MRRIRFILRYGEICKSTSLHIIMQTGVCTIIGRAYLMRRGRYFRRLSNANRRIL